MLTHYTVLYAGGQPRHFSPSAERWLKAQAWTANYWDLAACVRAAVLRTDADVLDAEALGASSSAAPRAATGDEDMRVRLRSEVRRVGKERRGGWWTEVRSRKTGRRDMLEQ